MSVRNGFALLLALSTLTFLVACGGGGGASIPNPTPTPTGSFSTSNLNGTYVFSVSGLDTSQVPFAIVGTLTADGNGGITAGALDINGTVLAPNVPVSSSSYTLGVDGRGTITLNAAAPIGKIGLDFVLQDSSHGLIIEYDGVASGSGTLDLQTAGVTPAGTYAFSFSGADANGNSFATVGAFTLGSGGAITSGLEDFNDGGFAYTNQALAGSVVAGPSSTPATTLTTQQFSTQTFDVFPIDSTHLKFIEMDALAIFSGDAFSQTSTSNTVPTGSLAFTLAGFISSAPAAVGGFMVTDGSGNITTASTQDINDSSGVSPSPLGFSGTYAATPTGTARFNLTLATGFAGGTLYAAYPSDGGLLLLEIDNSGIMAGVASLQSSTAFSTSQGYGLNLTGVNLGATTGSPAEVDDIAEFAANSSGTTVTGIIDENFAPGSSPIIPVTLNGTYLAPDTNGRGQISANAGTSSNTTLNGGFLLTFYTVDGTTFPFIESDGGQVATGVFVQQNPAGVSSATAHSRMFITRPLVRGHAARSKKQK